MIEPKEEVPGEFGHPNWKANVLLGLALCVIGVVMCMTVALFVYGAIAVGIGAVWTVAACIIGSMQERADLRRSSHGPTPHHP